MKNIIKFLLIMLMVFSFTSCGGQNIDSNEVKNNSEEKIYEALTLKPKPLYLPVPPDDREILMPVKSFIEESNYNLSSDKIFYTGKAVVLTYHHISYKPFSFITIRPERFEEDLKMLKDSNFNVISLRDLINAMEGNVKLPPNAVVITFDDGYESFYKHAYPLLKKYNMPATEFIITSWTETYSVSDAELNQLGPDEVREMYKSGLIDIQSHSDAGHDYIVRNEKGDTGGLLVYQMYDKGNNAYESEESYRARVLEDLSKSIPIIEKYTDNKSDIFCFPFGQFTTRLVEISKLAGFKYFVTTMTGNNRENSKSIYIKRIRSGDTGLNPQKLKESIISTGKQ